MERRSTRAPLLAAALALAGCAERAVTTDLVPASCPVLVEDTRYFPQSMDRCAADRFADPQDPSCGAICPCWRLVPDPGCRPAVDGSPYRFEILRRERAQKGAVAVVRCQVAPSSWGSPELAGTGQCL